MTECDLGHKTDLKRNSILSGSYCQMFDHDGVTVQGMAMILVCQFELLLFFWTLLPYPNFIVEPYVLVALLSSIGSTCRSLVLFRPLRGVQRYTCASVLTLLVPELISLNSFCRFLS